MEHRISTTAFIIFLIFAIIGEVLGLIPMVETIYGPLFWGAFSVFMWMKGMGLVNGKRMAVMIASLVTSVIPVVQSLPLELVAGIIAIFTMSRLEEKTGISMSSIKNKLKPTKKLPLNNGGVRLPNKTRGAQ